MGKRSENIESNQVLYYPNQRSSTPKTKKFELVNIEWLKHFKAEIVIYISDVLFASTTNKKQAE